MRYQKSISKASVSSHNSPRPFAVSELKWILSEMRGSIQWMWLCGWWWRRGGVPWDVYSFLFVVVVVVGVCAVASRFLSFPSLWHLCSGYFWAAGCRLPDMWLHCEGERKMGVRTHLHHCLCVRMCLCVFVIIWTGRTEMWLWPSAILLSSSWAQLLWLCWCLLESLSEPGLHLEWQQEISSKLNGKKNNTSIWKH